MHPNQAGRGGVGVLEVALRPPGEHGDVALGAVVDPVVIAIGIVAESLGQRLLLGGGDQRVLLGVFGDRDRHGSIDLVAILVGDPDREAVGAERVLGWCVSPEILGGIEGHGSLAGRRGDRDRIRALEALEAADEEIALERVAVDGDRVAVIAHGHQGRVRDKGVVLVEQELRQVQAAGVERRAALGADHLAQNQGRSRISLVAAIAAGEGVERQVEQLIRALGEAARTFEAQAQDAEAGIVGVAADAVATEGVDLIELVGIEKDLLAGEEQLQLIHGQFAGVCAQQLDAEVVGLVGAEGVEQLRDAVGPGIDRDSLGQLAEGNNNRHLILLVGGIFDVQIERDRLQGQVISSVPCRLGFLLRVFEGVGAWIGNLEIKGQGAGIGAVVAGILEAGGSIEGEGVGPAGCHHQIIHQGTEIEADRAAGRGCLTVQGRGGWPQGGDGADLTGVGIAIAEAGVAAAHHRIAEFQIQQDGCACNGEAV